MTRMFFILNLAIMLIISASCKIIPKESELKHAVEQPIADRFSYQWSEMSDREYKTVLEYSHKEDYGLRSDGILSADHPARMRLQYHVDKIDDNLRQMYPMDLKNIPRPKVQIIATSISNAFVYPVSTCTQIPIMFDGGQNRSVSRFWEFDRFSGEFYDDMNPQNPVRCVGYRQSSLDLKPLLSWHFRNLKNCTYRVAENEIVLGTNCQSYFKNGLRSDAAQQLVLMSIPTAITIHGGIITNFSEKEVIFTLSHEMAHYYRAHGLASSDEFQIYYFLKKRNSDSKPTHDPSLNSFREEIEGLKLKMKDRGYSALSLADRRRWQQLNRYAFKNNIGQYTSEQEADEYALEWSANYGVSPEATILSQFKRFKYEGNLDDGGWTYQKCLNAYQNDWYRSDDSKDFPVIAPIGDYSDDHHSTCFRIFNSHREKDVHQFRKGVNQAKFLPSSEWSAIQQDLRRTIDTIEQ